MIVLFLALMLDFKGPGLALVALYGILAVMAIPVVNSISQDVVSISDDLEGGARGLKVP